jgi:signal transduction histidine kinase/ActR/RegA family two-component response regulator
MEADQQWRALPLPARLYVAAVIVAGVVAILRSVPTTYPPPVLFAALLVAACLMSAWKIPMPVAVTNGCTLSVADAANIMSLLLLGSDAAALIAVAGVWIQCTYNAKQRDPLHRTLFSMAALALTMVAAGSVYEWSSAGAAPPTTYAAVLSKPLVLTLGIYFLGNSTLMAAAIALSTGRAPWTTWRDDFLWSASTFMVAGVAGAIGAVVVARGEHWRALLLLAPVYLTYRTYEALVGRLDDQKRHAEAMRTLHGETVAALRQAREAERALADEKERLAVALTEMTRLEEQRHQLLEREQIARASAETANRLKDHFLAVVSHELRTPLNAILGWADMLCRGTLEDRQRQRASRTILDSAKRQSQLIDDLLDVARISSGKLRLNRAILDPRDVVLDAVHVVQPLAEAKGLRLTVDAAVSVGGVYGDAARLQQVVSNLLSNAVKFTPDGGSVHVSVRQIHAVIELAVADSGEGIAADFLGAVFEPFRQADASSTRTHPGLGLGLSIVRSLVQAHHGSVHAESGGVGRGATFIVRLPAVTTADVSDNVDEFGSGSAADGQTWLDGISVLVVDDDRECRDVVAAHLQERRAHVITAASARQALDVIQQEHIDVMLSDIAMPGEDGYSLVRRVRALESAKAASIPAAALTALAHQEDRQRALQSGFQLHLAKPVDPRSLVAAVTTLHRLNAV